MYLSLLKDEEKRAFLNFANALSAADGDTSSDEKTMIDHYCEEMGIENNGDFVNDIKDTVDSMAVNSDEKSKKIAVFELIGLALVDNRYEETEKGFIEEIVSKFDLSSEYVEACENTAEEYINLQKKINALILG